MGAFGSGVAGQIARLHPFVREEYMKKFKTKGWEPGDVQIIKSDSKIFANMATQKTFGNTGVHVDYEACLRCFSKLMKYSYENSLDVAMPMVGSGLAGGIWSRVEDQLTKSLKRYDVEVNIYYL